MHPRGVLRERERLSITREDSVTEGSAGVYAQNDTQWNDWFRSILGIRYDWYRFNVDSIIPENSGNVTSGMASPKASLVFGPSVLPVRENIVNEHDAAVQNSPSRGRRSILIDWIPLHDLEPFGQVSEARRHAIDIAVRPVHQGQMHRSPEKPASGPSRSPTQPASPWGPASPR